jgi:hypothetical protein
VFSAVTAKERVQNRKLRKALAHATPVEKEVLKTLISLGKWEVCLDPGSRRDTSLSGMVTMTPQRRAQVVKSYFIRPRHINCCLYYSLCRFREQLFALRNRMERIAFGFSCSYALHHGHGIG